MSMERLLMNLILMKKPLENVILIYHIRFPKAEYL